MLISSPRMQQVPQAMTPVAVPSDQGDDSGAQVQMQPVGPSLQPITMPLDVAVGRTAANRRPGNTAFDTGFDRAPAMTPAGRNADAGAAASHGAAPQLARALAEYGAMRAMR